MHALEMKKLVLQDGRCWRDLDIQKLFVSYVERIDFSANVPITRRMLLQLPNHLHRTYALWNDGADLRTVLKPATYYRQRRELKAHGVDIGAQRVA